MLGRSNFCSHKKVRWNIHQNYCTWHEESSCVPTSLISHLQFFRLLLSPIKGGLGQFHDRVMWAKLITFESTVKLGTEIMSLETSFGDFRIWRWNQSSWPRPWEEMRNAQKKFNLETWIEETLPETCCYNASITMIYVFVRCEIAPWHHVVYKWQTLCRRYVSGSKK